MFRYRAKNAQGWGPFSDSLSLIAARRTDQPDTVVTSNEGTEVKITWSEPAYDGGSPLLGFRITILADDGSYYETRDHCWGEDQTTKGNLFCLVSMTVLRQDPYFLTQGSVVKAKVEGLNIIGYSEPSITNVSGADIRTPPNKPSALVQRVDEETTDT